MKITKTFYLFAGLLVQSICVDYANSTEFLGVSERAIVERVVSNRTILTSLENGFCNAVSGTQENFENYQQLVRDTVKNFEVVIEKNSAALEEILEEFREALGVSGNKQYDGLFKQIIVATRLTTNISANSPENLRIKEGELILETTLESMPFDVELAKARAEFWEKVNGMNLKKKGKIFAFKLPNRCVVSSSLDRALNALWSFREDNPKAARKKFFKEVSALEKDLGAKECSASDYAREIDLLQDQLREREEYSQSVTAALLDKDFMIKGLQDENKRLRDGQILLEGTSKKVQYLEFRLNKSEAENKSLKEMLVKTSKDREALKKENALLRACSMDNPIAIEENPRDSINWRRKYEMLNGEYRVLIGKYQDLKQQK